MTFQSIECGGALNPEVVQSTAHSSGKFPASNVLILGEKDALVNGKYNYWLAEARKTEGQGFTLKLDNCARMIAGCQIKNIRGPHVPCCNQATKGFKVSGSKNETGPWEILVEDELINRGNKPASLVNFTFVEPVEIQYIKFDLVSYWSPNGGGLQYFAAIPATSK